MTQIHISQILTANAKYKIQILFQAGNEQVAIYRPYGIFMAEELQCDCYANQIQSPAGWKLVEGKDVTDENGPYMLALGWDFTLTDRDGDPAIKLETTVIAPEIERFIEAHFQHKKYQTAA